MKHIKMLGLVAFSAMALVALLGTASASAASFTATENNKALSTKTLEAEVFTITGSNVECATTKFEGVTEGTLEGGEYHSGTQRVHPVYENCKAFGFESGVSVTTTGCDYLFGSTTTSGMGNVQIVNHAGETCTNIVITADPPFTTCTAKIPPQTVSAAVSYTNNSGKIKVKATATGIETNVTQSSGLCPLTTGNHTGASGGSYKGEAEVSAGTTSIKYTP
jgi:hypothetical protein